MTTAPNDRSNAVNQPTREVFFQTDKNGKRRAYRWSRMQFRAFPMGLDEAEVAIATGEAIKLPGHPFPKVTR